MSTTEMPTQTGSKTSPSYVLRDELAQFCLPKADNDPARKVAWTNTLCLCVLAIGIMGIQKPMALILKLKAEETQPVVIEDNKPVQQEFVRREETQEEEPQDAQPEQPLLPTVVAIDTGNVSFPVAVEGPVVVASSPVAAAPPPRVITRQVAPPAAKPSNEPTRFAGFGKKGKDGFVPTPDISDLPKELQKNLPRGTVIMRMQFTVTTQGQITNIQIEKGSPYPVFDQFMIEWYKRKGTFVARETDVSYYENVKINFPE
jgi:hypothetical protein